jgi:hypothetical protein
MDLLVYALLALSNIVAGRVRTLVDEGPNYADEF